MKNGFSMFRVTFAECKHHMMYFPIPNIYDLLWCEMCHDYRTCHRVEKAYRIGCESCAMRREYGTDRQRIEQLGRKHMKDFPRHKVFLFANERKVELQIAQESTDIVT